MQTIPLRTGAQQGDPFGVVLVCVDILPATWAQCAATMERDGTPGVTYLNAIAKSPATITRVATEDFVALRADLTAVGITKAPGKIFALPPDGRRATSEELQLLTDTNIGLAPWDGLVCGGGPGRMGRLCRRLHTRGTG